MELGQITVLLETILGREGQKGVVDETEREGDCVPAEFHSITVLIIHPSWDLTRLSDETGLKPLRSWRMGEARSTPKGTPLPGNWEDSRWTYVWVSSESGGFEKSIKTALSTMQAARAFLNELRVAGGQLSLIIRLPGCAHQGGEICNDVVSCLTKLGFALGIEVFPDGL